MNRTLHDAVTAAGLPVTHACEVGVYLPDTSNVLGWIEDGVRTTLVECDPEIVTRLRARWGDRPTVRIEPVAVADEPGTLTLYRTGASTFGSNVPSSPALVNDAYRPDARDAFTVPAVTFDTIDDGTIDVLSIDIEGGEWFVLKHLASRPQVISVETHGKHYANPFQAQIDAWMATNGYAAWYRDRSDTVYRRGWTGPVEDRSPPRSLGRRVLDTLRGRG